MHSNAGTKAQSQDLTDVNALIAWYYDVTPDADDAAQRVSFGTSGHRGTSEHGSFNELHVAAITQAVCEYRTQAGITGPLLLGFDTHGLSQPAFRTVMGVAAGNNVDVLIDRQGAPVPTPALSHAILKLNREGQRADGLIITPSHNPPTDGGIKYNPPHGGPAEGEITAAIEARANEILRIGMSAVQMATENEAFAAADGYDFMGEYVKDLASIVDMQAIAEAGVRIGIDPLGGAAVAYWKAIADEFGLNLKVTNDQVDPTWHFMPLDHDGKIRMDCSSPHAMANLLQLREDFDIAIGNDADADRHGIVTPDAGLMNPNHFLAVAIDHLLRTREQWSADAGIGKTLVSSALIDAVVADHGRALREVPVGFKWFVEGLHDGSLVFGGEESAGASFARRDGSVWTTDKDGIVMGLLAAEILAVRQQTPSQIYAELTDKFGTPAYQRVDAPATREQKAALKNLSASDITADEIAGHKVTRVDTRASGNDAAIGGVKVSTDRAWFAARPSGTEDLYKIYAESMEGPEHLEQVHADARAVVDAAFEKAES